nr:Fur family transcriptional regulator [Candidatus Sigynarchaeum springense]MDO8116455.1 Fur family transcriptional regulator [Candidatus Sigynarchaeota archaeon]
MSSFTRNDLIERLRSEGYKVTPQRLAICELILGRKDHPNAESIFVEIRKKYPSMSRATIYNTLHLLKKIGLVQEIGFDNGTTRFDPDTSVHINLVCRSCGKIVDVKDDQVEKAWLAMVAKVGVRPMGQRLDLHHQCDDCRHHENEG